MTQTLATRYYVTRDPQSEFPELNGNTDEIISQDPHDDAHYTVCVWGNGSALEQALNEASSVIRFTELGSVVADLLYSSSRWTHLSSESLYNMCSWWEAGS